MTQLVNDLRLFRIVSPRTRQNILNDYYTCSLTVKVNVHLHSADVALACRYIRATFLIRITSYTKEII